MEMCTTVALALLLLGTIFHSALVLGHWTQGVLNGQGQSLSRRVLWQIFHSIIVSQNNGPEGKSLLCYFIYIWEECWHNMDIEVVLSVPVLPLS